MNKHSSIFSIEITAILHCVIEICRMNSHNKKFLILTDSLSSLTTIQNKFSENPLIQKVHQIIFNIQFFDIKIKFMYVPSYVGINGNETVDESAKSAENPTRLTILNPDDIQNILKQIQYSKWQNLRNSKTNNKLFLRKKKPSSHGKKFHS